MQIRTCSSPAHHLLTDVACRNLLCESISFTPNEAGIEWCGWGWHGFRRGLATTLYQLGTEAKTRQAILRHANVAITEQRYTKPVSAVYQKLCGRFKTLFRPT
jgi:site-specific recombinase XerD